MIQLRTIDGLQLRDQRVFYRVDYNVPLADGRVGDATRIEATIPTLRLMRERDARIVIASHLGRPKGQRNEKFSLAPVRRKLEEILGVPVAWASDCVGAEAKEKAAALGPGQILLLENLRFHPGEESNDAGFAAELAELADSYVNDAFGASHRAHASIVALPESLPKEKTAAGFLLAREVEFLQKVTEIDEGSRPFVAILGGAKIKGKIEPLEAMVRLADTLLIGGGMANTFLAAEGRSLGSSLVDADSIEVAKKILEGGERAEVRIPCDLVVTDSLEAPTRTRVVESSEPIPEGEMAVDIGPRTIDAYAKVLAEARTIFWNGPMGVFENEAFAKGTRAVAKAVADGDALSVVGGGESVEAVNQSGMAENITHISTGGGASLEFISGRVLPGVEALREQADA